MSFRRALRFTAVPLAAALTLSATGCTSLREIPRADYTRQPDRRDVRVVTRDGLEYEFDYAHVAGDSLIGYRSRDTEGRFEEFGVLRLPLDEVTQMSARKFDWLYTSLIGGALVAGGVVAGFAVKGRDKSGNTTSGGGKNPVP